MQINQLNRISLNDIYTSFDYIKSISGKTENYHSQKALNKNGEFLTEIYFESKEKSINQTQIDIYNEFIKAFNLNIIEELFLNVLTESEVELFSKGKISQTFIEIIQVPFEKTNFDIVLVCSKEYKLLFRRKKYISLRKNFTSDEVQEMSKKIFELFRENFSVSAGQNVHVFLSIEKFNEVETKFFINYFKKHGARIFLPKMIKGKLIAAELGDEKSLVKNNFGILEPQSLENECSHFDLIITPLLYADAEGNRVGYGKGYYDGFFSTINENAVKIGVGFFSPKESVEDIEDHDVTLDYLITPESILSFNGLEKKSKK